MTGEKKNIMPMGKESVARERMKALNVKLFQ